MTKPKIITLAWVLLLWVILLLSMGETSKEPCSITVSRKDSVEQIEQWIADCEVAIEKTSLDFDELSKKRQNELDVLKNTNEQRRKEIERIRKEVMGLSQEVVGDEGKE